MILNLGVVDIPYAEHGSVTTFDVAKKLEQKYGVMGEFYNLHQKDIAVSLENSVNNAIDSILSGALLTLSPFAEAEKEIEELFMFEFLEQGEVERLGIEGVPTKASLSRRSLRFKSKVGKTNRPSFIDTGTYEKSFKVWIEE